MAEFIDSTVIFSPKPKVVETTFTHFLSADGKVEKLSNNTKGSAYEHVLYLGTYMCRTVELGLFKAWDTNFDDATLYLGIKGTEEYESM